MSRKQFRPNVAAVIFDPKNNKVLMFRRIAKKNEESKLFNFPKGTQIGIIGKNNIVKIKKCLTQWCLIQYQKNEGWIKKENIWGVYKNEIYKINFTQPLIEIYWKFMSYIQKS